MEARGVVLGALEDVELRGGMGGDAGILGFGDMTSSRCSRKRLKRTMMLMVWCVSLKSFCMRVLVFGLGPCSRRTGWEVRGRVVCGQQVSVADIGISRVAFERGETMQNLSHDI